MKPEIQLLDPWVEGTVEYGDGYLNTKIMSQQELDDWFNLLADYREAKRTKRFTLPEGTPTRHLPGGCISAEGIKEML